MRTVLSLLLAVLAGLLAALTLVGARAETLILTPEPLQRIAGPMAEDPEVRRAVPGTVSDLVRDRLPGSVPSVVQSGIGEVLGSAADGLVADDRFPAAWAEALERTRQDWVDRLAARDAATVHLQLAPVVGLGVERIADGIGTVPGLSAVADRVREEADRVGAQQGPDGGAAPLAVDLTVPDPDAVPVETVAWAVGHLHRWPLVAGAAVVLLILALLVAPGRRRGAVLTVTGASLLAAGGAARWGLDRLAAPADLEGLAEAAATSLMESVRDLAMPDTLVLMVSGALVAAVGLAMGLVLGSEGHSHPVARRGAPGRLEHMSTVPAATAASPAPVSVGMPHIPRARRSRDEVEAAAVVKGDKKVMLAAPRGYCAGVDRAVVAVEKALEHHGAPVYVRKEIVHNRHVVETLEAQGVVFVNELDEVPEGSLTVFSAHGVSPAVVNEAAERSLKTIDATCPLVTKVHREAVRFAKQDRHILLIGHEGHEEVEGTYGEAPDHTTIVNNPEEARTVQVDDPDNLIWLSQTTLSVDETLEIVSILRERFPNLQDPPSDDICYATSNRQAAIKKISPACDLVIIVGSANSSNSVRLKEVALEYGAQRAERVDFAHQVDESWFEGIATVGLSSGASVPETLVTDVLALLAEYGYGEVEEIVTAEEDIVFSLPKELRAELKRVGDTDRSLGGRGRHVNG